MDFKRIFISGGAGYVGAVLVPKLLNQGYDITVLDLMLYGEEVLTKHPQLLTIKGDIRDQELLKTHQTLIISSVYVRLCCFFEEFVWFIN